MQVTQTLNDGLKRGYEITVPATELEAKVTEKLEEARKDFQMKGFRKGKAPAALMKYLLPKGFVALNGCSLTIGRVEGDTFDVWLIPETLRATTYGELQVGALVNLEIDAQTQAIVDTVERVLAERGLLAAAG